MRYKFEDILDIKFDIRGVYQPTILFTKPKINKNIFSNQ